MKSLSKCSRSSPLSLGSLLLICCRDDPWILACSSGWEMWVMEWKRTFWKMRGHVGFDAVLFKIQHVRVFFCHCWVKLKPLSLFCWEERSRNGWLELRLLCRAAQGRRAHSLCELSPWSHRSQWSCARSVHLHTWERKSRNWGQMEPPWCPCAAGQGRGWKASGASLFCCQGPLAPRGAGARGGWGCSLLFVCVHLEETWAELPALLTAKEMDLRGTINFAWLFLSQVKL